jgi:hypothetical protein
MTRERKSMDGWRFWLVPRRVDKLQTKFWPVLLSPHDLKDHGATTDTMTPWEEPTLRAECRRDPDHVPPVPDCLCGIYAVEHVLDIMFRSNEAHGTIIWTNTHLWRTKEMPAVVIGRVTLADARYLPVGAGDGPMVAPEWRARSATLEEIFVPLYAGDWDSAELASLLSKNYGVPAQVGDPPVTKKDRKTKPAWIDDPTVDLGVPPALNAIRQVSEALGPKELACGLIGAATMNQFLRGRHQHDSPHAIERPRPAI